MAPLDVSSSPPPLIAHVIDRLQIGGMENGLVNLINGTPPTRFRHAVVCLRTATDFRRRIVHADVPVVELNKAPGRGLAIYWRLWQALRQLAPDIVHTRNLPAIDMPPVAALAGVGCRVHSEHGRDIFESHGGNRKYNLVRRAVSPFVHRYISVSKDIDGWLQTTVGIPPRKCVQIYNGVDAERFHPADGGPREFPKPDFAGPEHIVIGTVGRLETIKNQIGLVRAFNSLVAAVPDGRQRLRLVLIGDGSRRGDLEAELDHAGTAGIAWITGDRDDVPDLLRQIDIFVLPSINEGISNTILEAMASGLPVVATDVGGNPELVVDTITGRLVPADDDVALCQCLRDYVESVDMRQAHGRAGRVRIEQEFSLTAMVGHYLAVYDGLLGRGTP
jgi:sugar transferase (PEP-CTERM/EpsH1 system associated)